MFNRFKNPLWKRLKIFKLTEFSESFFLFPHLYCALDSLYFEFSIQHIFSLCFMAFGITYGCSFLGKDFCWFLFFQISGPFLITVAIIVIGWTLKPQLKRFISVVTCPPPPAVFLQHSTSNFPQITLSLQLLQTTLSLQLPVELQV